MGNNNREVNTLLQDSVVGGNLHSGNVTNHYYHVNEVKSVPILKTKRKQPKRKQTLPTKVKRQRPKRKGTLLRSLVLVLAQGFMALFLMVIALLGIFVSMFILGVDL